MTINLDVGCPGTGVAAAYNVGLGETLGNVWKTAAQGSNMAVTVTISVVHSTLRGDVDKHYHNIFVRMNQFCRYFNASICSTLSFVLLTNVSNRV